MKILAIDTSSKICAVALLENNEKIAEKSLDNGRTHSENLMPLMKALLEENNIKLEEIDLIAVSVGPGSFTGIRIGISSIKPIAEVYNIPVASVTSLETLARNVENVEKDVTIVSLIDARNNQVYCGIFDENYKLKQEEMADDINIILENLKQYKKIVIVGDGAVLHQEKIKEAKIDVRLNENNTQNAENTGKMGYQKYLENNLKNADTILPIYLRKSQAERLKK